MAGIYFHIPFCKKRCNYCDFFSITALKSKPALLEAMLLELKLKKPYIENETIETIYFGGGTPSLLNEDEINVIIQEVRKHYSVDPYAEITLEANPDDINLDYAKAIFNMGINRISIGIQSFFDDDLILMNRRHNSLQAKKSLEYLIQAGFKNISSDLIYGLPNSDEKKWKDNLGMVFDFDIQHLSAYHMTFEENTIFNSWKQTGEITEIAEENSLRQYDLLVEISDKNGFQQYEISNFCKDEMFSKHNSGYWKNKSYLGIGPSAHSYNLSSRQWNISDINEYINGVNKESGYFEKEDLSFENKLNEFLITRLRTVWGISLHEMEKLFGKDEKQRFVDKINLLNNNQLINIQNQTVSLTKKGLFLSDYIFNQII